MAKRREPGEIPAPQWSQDEKAAEAEAKIQAAEARVAEAEERLRALEESLRSQDEASKEALRIAEDQRRSSDRSLEFERSAREARDLALKETRAQLEDHRVSLAKVATHRDQLAAENADLQRAGAKAKAAALQTESGVTEKAKEAQAIRDLLAKERAEHQKEAEALRAELRVARSGDDRIRALERENSTLRAQLERTLSASPVAPGVPVEIDGGVFVDEGTRKEILRRLPRTDSNEFIFKSLGA